MSSCDQELCEHWAGDGEVCICALFGIERQPATCLHGLSMPHVDSDFLSGETIRCPGPLAAQPEAGER